MLGLSEKIVILTTIFLSFSLISTVSIIPLIHKIGIKFNLIDKPDFRKIHKGKIVRLGGLGIFSGFLIGIAFFYFIYGKIDFFDVQFKNTALVLFGSFCFLVIGFIDDVANLSPYVRLAFQFIVTSALFSFGLKIDAIDFTWINSNLDPVILNNFFSFLFVSFWVVGLTNAINWLDGLDALASGISLIILLGLSCIFISLEKWELFFICSALCGSIIGFLRYNVFPAKIMMGDCGSYLLGSSLGILSILGLSFKVLENSAAPDLVESIEVFPIHLAVIIFFVPLFDMCYVIFIRMINGHSPFYPDRNHIHHKLLNRGINERSTSIILYSISLVFGIIALSIFGIDGKVFFMCGSFIFILISLLYVLNMKRYLGQNNEPN